MRTGTHTPWGSAQTVEQLGDEVWMVTTAGHGGVYMTAKAVRRIPAAVRSTFMNGASWAEEDCEASIALAILERKGVVTASRLHCGVETLRRAARAIAESYPRYRAALAHLPPAPAEKRTAA